MLHSSDTGKAFRNKAHGGRAGIRWAGGQAGAAPLLLSFGLLLGGARMTTAQVTFAGTACTAAQHDDGKAVTQFEGCDSVQKGDTVVVCLAVPASNERQCRRRWPMGGVVL